MPIKRYSRKNSKKVGGMLCVFRRPTKIEKT